MFEWLGPFAPAAGRVSFLVYVLFLCAVDLFLVRRWNRTPAGRQTTLFRHLPGRVPESAATSAIRHLHANRHAVVGYVIPAVIFVAVGPLANSLFDVDADDASAHEAHGWAMIPLAALGLAQVILYRHIFLAIGTRLLLEKASDERRSFGFGGSFWLWAAMVVAWGATAAIIAMVAHGHAALATAGAFDFFGLNPSWSVSCAVLMQIGLLFVTAGMAFDGLDAGEEWAPLRRGVMFGLVLFLLAAPSLVGGPEEITITERAGSDDDPVAATMARLVARVQTIPASHPALIVTAAGGGSRAAVFAAMSYELLAQPWEEFARLTGAHPPAVETGSSAPIDDLVLVSAVSGGSLASAEFFARRIWAEDEPSRAGDLRGLVLGSRVVRRMRTNFYAPMLTGVFTLGVGRAGALTERWKHEYNWSGAWRDAEERSGKERRRAFPQLLLNATVAASGRRITMGYPELAPAFWEEVQHAGPVAGEVVLAPLRPQGVVAVEDAVRLSASFPFGMDMARLGGIDEPGRDSEQGRRITDGGVLDNTGIDVVERFLASIAWFADAPCGDGPSRCVERKAVANEARTLLCEHGVRVIEIDSGAKPGRTGKLHLLAPDSIVALESLDWAAYLRERMAVREALAASGKHLGCPEEVRPTRVSYVAARWKEGEKKWRSVPTAWALGRTDTMDLIDQFVGVYDLRRPSDLAPGARAAEALLHRNPAPDLAASGDLAEAVAELFDLSTTKPFRSTDPFIRSMEDKRPDLRRLILANQDPGAYLLDEFASEGLHEVRIVRHPSTDQAQRAVELGAPTVMFHPEEPRVLGIVQAGTEVALAVPAAAPSPDRPDLMAVALQAADAEHCAGHRVDVFACVGVAGAWLRAETYARALTTARKEQGADNPYLGGQRACLKLRSLTPTKQAVPDYAVSEDLIRYDLPSEQDVASALQRDLEGAASAQGVTLATSPASIATPGYLSVLVCKAPAAP